MANADKTSIPAVSIGVLAFFAAVLSFVSYHAVGVWPAKLGGWEIPLFVLFGVVLVLYGRWWPR